MPPTNPGDEYHWVNQASMFYIHRMQQLNGLQECEERAPYSPEANYLMYRHRCFKVAGSNRWCEFLMEYDIYHPSHGIYFGCKVVTAPHCDHLAEIALAIHDWTQVKPIVLLRLNNVFPDKDFTHRFRLTDNDANHTYWPFWIQLYEDEDIIAVGLRALNIIASVYAEYFEGCLQLPPDREALAPKILPPVRTAFTHESLIELNNTLEKLFKAGEATKSPRPGEEGVKLFHHYLHKAQESGWIFRSGSYEYAWILSGNMHDVDFYEMMQNIIGRVYHDLGIKKIKVPWGALVRIFLRADGTTMKEQIRTLSPKAAVKKTWKARISSL